MKKVAIIGTGMGALSAAVLLAQHKLEVILLEQNWIPGGCTTSYPRKHFVFEAGATTLIGLDSGMPLDYLSQKTGIQWNARLLDVPMQIITPTHTITRYSDRNAWILECERVFGVAHQRKFWETCFQISDFVWDASVRYLGFPPATLHDLWQMARQFAWRDIPFLKYAWLTVDDFLKHHQLHKHEAFKAFINEQLMITAQNEQHEVNMLFGATALCYTNYGNYYIDGGLRNLVQPMVDYVLARGGTLHLRKKVTQIKREAQKYTVFYGENEQLTVDFVVSGIPLNDVKPLLNFNIKQTILEGTALNSAFQMGIVFKSDLQHTCLHHQIHLPHGFPELGSKSIFISLQHPKDTSRGSSGHCIASVSTHWPHPDTLVVENTEALEQFVLETLIKHGFFKSEDVVYVHSSSPKSWQKWTGRWAGFVGGYPQFKKIKPWQLNEARLDRQGAYACGDSVYPGQGIPGVALSGIIAAQKLLADHF